MNNNRLSRLLPLLTLLLTLTACASSRTAIDEVEPAPDPAIETMGRAASLAYRSGRYEQATILYTETLRSAMERDQWLHIIDARFNLALTATALGQYSDALSHLDLAAAEQRRHSSQPDQQITLLRATINYRKGDLQTAASTLSALIKNQGTPLAIRTRAHFISGLLSADQSDTRSLLTHISALKRTENNPAKTSTDQLELQARLHGLQNDIKKANTLFDKIIVSRRKDKDYRGMVRALASCADMLAEDQPALAANYYLRAGRSAAQRNEPKAPHWLKLAKTLGVENKTLRREADELLQLTKNSH